MAIAVELLAYWPPRRESIEECVERLYSYLTELGPIHPALERWYEKGRRRKDALKGKVAIDRKSLRQLLDKGRNRREMDNSIIEHLGFHRGLWNGGRSGTSVSLDVTCGTYSSEGSNDIYLGGDAFTKGLEQHVALALVRATVSSWQPEWVGVCSRQAVDEIDHGVHRPLVDWIVFHRLQRHAPLQSPSRVAFELDGGECIVVQDGPVVFDDPKQRTRSVAVAKALGL